MKKGFTLVEMLGIVTVLAVVLLVTFPALNKSLKQMKITAGDNFTNNLKISTEAYVGINIDKFPELDSVGGTIEVKIQDLYDANLLKGKDENIDPNSKITVEVQADKSLKYYYDGKEIGFGG